MKPAPAQSAVEEENKPAPFSFDVLEAIPANKKSEQIHEPAIFAAAPAPPVSKPQVSLPKEENDETNIVGSLFSYFTSGVKESANRATNVVSGIQQSVASVNQSE